MRTLRLSLLGPFQVSLGAQSLTRFESNKVRALLAYLAVEAHQPHARETLAEMIWPGLPAPSALADLRYALADLRRVIADSDADPPYLLISRERLQFNLASHCALDIGQFQELSQSGEISKLEQANALYRADFLAGFPSIESPAFEEWLLRKRQQYREQAAQVLQAISRCYEARGDYQRALPFARRQLDMEPLDEEVHQQIMRLLTFAGQRVPALLQYARCKDLLDHELHIAPSSHTTALYESIRDGTFYVPVHLATPSITPRLPPNHNGPFVAREQELSALGQRLESVLAAQGCVAFVTGEAGSGKTTLVREFLRRAQQAHAALVTVYSNCNSFAGSIDPYLPFIEVFKTLAGDMGTQQASGSADLEQSRRIWDALPVMVRALVESGPELVDRFVNGRDLLTRARTLEHFQASELERLIQQKAVPVPPSGPGGGALRQSKLFEQTGSVLRAVSHTHPLLIALDDLQWADQDTVSLFFYLCRRLGGSRIMIIGTYRLEEAALPARESASPFFPALRVLQAASSDAPIDLSRSDSRHFVNALLDSEPNALGGDFRAALEQHTDGIPLFVVELLRGMQQRGDLVKDDAGRWVANHALDWESLPPRVEAVIAQQIEKLPGEYQRALSVASVEGDEFSAEILAAVLDCPPQELTSLLSGPLSRVYHTVVPLGVQRAGPPGNRLSRYRFRHHLFQRYFESSQDVIERARLHEAVGNALEVFYDGHSDDIAVPLARHFELAGLRAKAASYLLMAGRKAQRLFANEEAIRHFRRGLDLIASLPPGLERDRLELPLQLALGTPLIATQGHNADAIEQAYSRARQLVERCGDRKDLFQVLSLLKSYYNLRGDRSNSEETTRLMLQIAEETRDSDLLAISAVKVVTNSFYYGQWAQFRRYVDRTLELYDLERHRSLTHQMGGDPKGLALALGGVALWMLGYPEQGRRFTQAALAHERDVAIPAWSWFAYDYVAQFHIYAEELEPAGRWLDAASRLCAEHGMSHYGLYTECLRGWLRARTGDNAGISNLEQGAAWLHEIGDLMNSFLFLRLLADAYYTYRLPAEGLETIEKALALTRETEMIFEEPELWRLRGELLLCGSEVNEAAAEDSFLRAIASASSQGTKMWELRATVSLARLWCQHGHWKQAHERLESIYNWFTEGFETDDLRHARDALDGICAPQQA